MSPSLLITKLRPFVLICQINGLVPFSMEMDPVTGRFLKFTFSYKKFVFWWYAFVAIFQVSVVLCFSLMSSGINIKTGEESGLSTIVVALTLVTRALYMIQVFLARIILLRYKHLRKAIALIREVEAYLIEEIPHHHSKKDYIVFRTIVGLVLRFLSVP